jgi:hypothetical protein
MRAGLTNSSNMHLYIICPALGAFSLGLPRSRAAQLRQTGLVLRQARRASERDAL